MEFDGGGGGGGGESASKRARLSTGDSDPSDASGEDDRLSALPDDVLIFILLHLTTRAAARTSVLSRHWRRVWSLLPALRFRRKVRDALDARAAPLSYLFVADHSATAESLGVWLPAAARRVSGDLILRSITLRGPHLYDVDEGEEERGEEAAAAAPRGGAFVLPCFEKATSIRVLLSFHGLAVPVAGVFARLTSIHLARVWFRGPPGDLGDAFSSPRCPCLQRLDIHRARGLSGLSIRSDSMLYLGLRDLRALSRLTVVAPALRELTVEFCFAKSGAVASISAPQLGKLVWNDVYDQSSVDLGKMEHLRLLGTYSCFVYRYGHFMRNQSCISLLERFGGIETLLLTLVYPWDPEYYCQYMKEDMAVIPISSLMVDASGHAFMGSALFHVLRLCTGIRRLMLQFVDSVSKAQTLCSWGCICNHPADWETKELLLNHLEEVEIVGFRGSEQEVAFVKRVFNWRTKIKEMRVTFSCVTSETEAKELYEIFQIFSRPGVCMKFYIHRDSSVELYAPKD